MAASIFIEQESGTYTRRIHRHNGYYAGDFSMHRPGFIGQFVFLPPTDLESGEGGVVRSSRSTASRTNTA